MHEQPAVEGSEQEKRIGKGRPLWAQGPHKSIYSPQNGSPGAGIEEPLGGECRGSHRIRRLSQLPAGRGSS